MGNSYSVSELRRDTQDPKYSEERSEDELSQETSSDDSSTQSDTSEESEELSNEHSIFPLDINDPYCLLEYLSDSSELVFTSDTLEEAYEDAKEHLLPLLSRVARKLIHNEGYYILRNTNKQPIFFTKKHPSKLYKNKFYTTVDGITLTEYSVFHFLDTETQLLIDDIVTNHSSIDNNYNNLSTLSIELNFNHIRKKCKSRYALPIVEEINELIGIDAVYVMSWLAKCVSSDELLPSLVISSEYTDRVKSLLNFITSNVLGDSVCLSLTGHQIDTLNDDVKFALLGKKVILITDLGCDTDKLLERIHKVSRYLTREEYQLLDGYPVPSSHNVILVNNHMEFLLDRIRLKRANHEETHTRSDYLLCEVNKSNESKNKPYEDINLSSKHFFNYLLEYLKTPK